MVRNLAKRLGAAAVSNIDALITKATDPAKLAGLMRHEMEDAVVAMQGELTRKTRLVELLGQKAENHEAQAKEWAAKAKTAMEHKREDLARSALLAAEDDKQQAAAAVAEAKDVSGTVAELQEAMATLEAKLADAPVPAAKAKASGSGKAPHQRMMDRLDALEKRVGFASTGEPSKAEVEDEIAALAREKRVDEQLAKLKKRK